MVSVTVHFVFVHYLQRGDTSLKMGRLRVSLMHETSISLAAVKLDSAERQARRDKLKSIRISFRHDPFQAGTDNIVVIINVPTRCQSMVETRARLRTRIRVNDSCSRFPRDLVGFPLAFRSPR